MAYLDELGLDVLWTNTKKWFGRKLKITQGASSVSLELQNESEEALSAVDLPEVTPSSPGLMSSEDKSKLDGVEEGATANIGTITSVSTTPPLSGGAEYGGVIVKHLQSGVIADSYGNVSTTPRKPKFGETFNVPGFQVDMFGHIIEAGNHTVTIPNSRASSTADGLLSSADKKKLDTVEENATHNEAGDGIEITASGVIKNAGVRSIETGIENGTLLVDTAGDMQAVKVAGLRSAAYSNASEFATASQGVKADNAIPKTEKGVANGVATLDAAGQVPASQLPSYVDDVLEFSTLASFPESGETGKIYVAKDTNLTYRFSGSSYVEISQSLALGETSSTAYPGNKGKQLADTIATYGDVVTHNITAVIDTSDNVPTSSAVKDYVSNNDVRNTAGSEDSDLKLFIVGTTAQSDYGQTYSHKEVYIGDDDHLYSHDAQVVNVSDSQALTNKTYEGYTLDDASAKGVDTSIEDDSTSVNLPTSEAVSNFVEDYVEENVEVIPVEYINAICDADGESPVEVNITAGIHGIYTATCDTAANAKSKIVKLDYSYKFKLVEGTMVIVYFNNGNTAVNPELKVNDEESIAISYPSSENSTDLVTGDGKTQNTWQAHEAILFVYTGETWLKAWSAKTLEEAYRLASTANAGNTDSPAFTGNPTAPTPSTDSNDDSVATTAFVQAAIAASISGSSPTVAAVDSPSFTGTPTAPTPSTTSNDTTVATTAFVNNLLESKVQAISLEKIEEICTY